MKDKVIDSIKYILNMRPLFDSQAVFSDESPLFRTPFEPKAGEDVTIRIRTGAGQADHVYVECDGRRYPMFFIETKGDFSWFGWKMRLDKENVYYHFYLESGKHHFYYSKRGLTSYRVEDADFLICPGYHIPNWLRGAVMYQIYVDRFRNGDPSNDVMTDEYFYLGAPVRHIDDWDALPEGLEVGHFKGGDLQGVREKLDYLQSLGVEVIYFNPIFVSPSNHKYDAQDYEHIDPHLAVMPHDEGDLLPEGACDNSQAERYRTRVTDPVNLAASDRYFAEFMQEVHRRGMKVILDGVFNHCGSFNKWMNREKLYRSEMGYAKGAYESSLSPYRTYFDFHEDSWPDNGSYDGWWGHDTLPKLNYEKSKALQAHILSIAEKWLKPPYCVDGWRLDVAADLGHSPEFNHHFWQKFRQRVKAVNPEACILAEHYGDASSYLRGGEWDTVMNYDAFMEPLTFFLTGMEKHSDGCIPELMGNGRTFFDTMNDKMRSFTGASLMGAMNELDNHDHSRFLTRTNHKVGRAAELGAAAAGEDISYAVMRQAVMMQMTWIGAPTLYYGDEAGVVGFTDPDNRRTYPWGHENKDLLNFYTEMGRIRHLENVLKEGCQAELFEAGPVIAYGRFNNDEAVVTVVNASDEEREANISLKRLGISVDDKLDARILMNSEEEGWQSQEESIEAAAACLNVKVGARGCVIISIRKKGIK